MIVQETLSDRNLAGESLMRRIKMKLGRASFSITLPLVSLSVYLLL